MENGKWKMEKFQNKYRIESARAQWWDYGWNGAYFITICTQNREHFFGEITNGKMKLSHLGVIADLLWHEIPNHAKHVELGDFVVMPNHIHGILIIDNPILIQSRDLGNSGNSGNLGNSGNSGDLGNSGNSGDLGNVQTGHALSLPESESEMESESESKLESEMESESASIGQKRFQNIGKNTISSIIGSYKSAVTKHANRLGFENGWQTRFHDHIIRNNAEYQCISNYIVNNPSNWKEDKFHT